MIPWYCSSSQVSRPPGSPNRSSYHPFGQQATPLSQYHFLLSSPHAGYTQIKMELSILYHALWYPDTIAVLWSADYPPPAIPLPIIPSAIRPQFDHSSWTLCYKPYNYILSSRNRFLVSRLPTYSNRTLYYYSSHQQPTPLSQLQLLTNTI